MCDFVLVIILTFWLFACFLIYFTESLCVYICFTFKLKSTKMYTILNELIRIKWKFNPLMIKQLHVEPIRFFPQQMFESNMFVLRCLLKEINIFVSNDHQIICSKKVTEKTQKQRKEKKFDLLRQSFIPCCLSSKYLWIRVWVERNHWIKNIDLFWRSNFNLVYPSTLS